WTQVDVEVIARHHYNYHCQLQDTTTGAAGCIQENNGYFDTSTSSTRFYSQSAYTTDRDSSSCTFSSAATPAVGRGSSSVASTSSTPGGGLGVRNVLTGGATTVHGPSRFLPSSTSAFDFAAEDRPLDCLPLCQLESALLTTTRKLFPKLPHFVITGVAGAGKRFVLHEQEGLVPSTNNNNNNKTAASSTTSHCYFPSSATASSSSTTASAQQTTQTSGPRTTAHRMNNKKTTLASAAQSNNCSTKNIHVPFSVFLSLVKEAEALCFAFVDNSEVDDDYRSGCSAQGREEEDRATPVKMKMKVQLPSINQAVMQTKMLHGGGTTFGLQEEQLEVQHQSNTFVSPDRNYKQLQQSSGRHRLARGDSLQHSGKTTPNLLSSSSSKKHLISSTSSTPGRRRGLTSGPQPRSWMSSTASSGAATPFDVGLLGAAPTNFTTSTDGVFPVSSSGATQQLFARTVISSSTAGTFIHQNKSVRSTGFLHNSGPASVSPSKERSGRPRTDVSGLVNSASKKILDSCTSGGGP
ncbi:unnamed protein product, partial [Amoebophrya sp. A120]